MDKGIFWTLQIQNAFQTKTTLLEKGIINCWKMSFIAMALGCRGLAW